MSSAADSLAKTLASQAKAQDLLGSGLDSGTSSIASSKKSGRNTRSLKTSQPFDLKDWTKFSGGSLRSGTMRNGTVYPLPPLARLTDATAFGSWPTPTAVWRPMEGNVRILRAKVLAGEMTEAEATAMIGKSPLEAQGAIPALWPTPDASPHKYRLRGDSQQSRSLNGIHGGKLNPTWVEWLMGFPLDWTDLKPSEMPLSRKSRKSLAKR